MATSYRNYDQEIASRKLNFDEERYDPSLVDDETETTSCKVVGDSVVCGNLVATERRLKEYDAPRDELVPVPPRLLLSPRRRQELRKDALAAFIRLYDTAHREMPELNPSMLKLVSGYRGFDEQASNFKRGIREEFASARCDTIPPGRLAYLIDQTSRSIKSLPPDPSDRGRWPRAFFRLAGREGIGFTCGKSGATQLIRQRRKRIAPPGGSTHRSGRAVDLWLGHGIDFTIRNRHRRMPAFRFLVARASKFGFFPYVAEPWHWEYVPGSETGPIQQSNKGSFFKRIDLSRPILRGVSGLLRNEKLWLAGFALKTGERRLGKLTNEVFFRRHPERGRRRLERSEPGFQALANEWRHIRDTIAKSVLAGLSSQETGPASIPRLPLPWTDVELIDELGVSPGARRNQLGGFDRVFDNSEGTKFGNSINSAAAEFGVNPGLVAVNAVAETVRSTWVTNNRVTTTIIGLDYWGATLRRAVAHRVPKGDTIASRPTGRTFTNERRRNTGAEYSFPNGDEAMRAAAAVLRYAEIRIRDWIGDEAWEGLRTVEQFYLARLFYNFGPVGAKKDAKKAASGKSILITRGPAGAKHPRRTATIRAAQAVHLSQKSFLIPILR